MSFFSQLNAAHWRKKTDFFKKTLTNFRFDKKHVIQVFRSRSWCRNVMLMGLMCAETSALTLTLTNKVIQ